MLHNILKLNGLNILSKKDQRNTNGGFFNSCLPYLPENGCFSGPEHCNVWNLPKCPDIPDENH